MHLGSGMVKTTRKVFDESIRHGSKADLQSLTHSPADSLLRKLCASCHLGQDKQRHGIDDTRDRGGGCLACHLQPQNQGLHPALSARVGDGRCFGCHSRSGRIALNYSGLAEVESAMAPASTQYSQLLDGRLVEHRAADIHQRAGMSCIDCHTSKDVMGASTTGHNIASTVDIGCQDCHNNQQPAVSLDQFPPELEFFKARIPFATLPGQKFLVTANQSTPLWNIELRDQHLFLHRKLDNQLLEIPQWRAASHQLQEEHQRLHCDSCHSQWAPQCNGCHLQYDEAQEQWDHVDKQITAGRWIETRWDIHNDLPGLGVDQADQIRPFIPGMILTIEHPAWQTQKFKRVFSALSPHTSGAARDCDSCHGSSQALGLGAGVLKMTTDGWQFTPEKKILDDLLPADAWTTINGKRQGMATQAGARPLNRAEILRVLNADINKPR
ncbi:MAG: hypothetical protein QNJ69_08110 [Gammaproteobacteria bacterium]|nr:hypothetical protein [Gammaproteobacteria bacterium]